MTTSPTGQFWLAHGCSTGVDVLEPPVPPGKATHPSCAGQCTPLEMLGVASGPRRLTTPHPPLPPGCGESSLGQGAQGTACPRAEVLQLYRSQAPCLSLDVSHQILRPKETRRFHVLSKLGLSDFSVVVCTSSNACHYVSLGNLNYPTVFLYFMQHPGVPQHIVWEMVALRNIETRQKEHSPWASLPACPTHPRTSVKVKIRPSPGSRHFGGLLSPQFPNKVLSKRALFILWRYPLPRAPRFPQRPLGSQQRLTG